MAELADALDLGSSGATRGGSTPLARTINIKELFTGQRDVSPCPFNLLPVLFRQVIIPGIAIHLLLFIHAAYFVCPIYNVQLFLNSQAFFSPKPCLLNVVNNPLP